MNRYYGTKLSTRFLGAVLGSACGLAAVLARTSLPQTASDAVRSPMSTTSVPSTPDPRAQVLAFHQRNLPSFLEGRPTPYLPESERAPWIAAWNRMRDCARAHGFEGVSPVASTYGDGETAMPNIDVSDENAASTLDVCPFALESARLERVRRAVAGPQPLTP